MVLLFDEEVMKRNLSDGIKIRKYNERKKPRKELMKSRKICMFFII